MPKYSVGSVAVLLACAVRIFAAESDQEGDAPKRDEEVRAALAKAEAIATDTREAREAFQFAYIVITAHDTESVKSGRVDISASVVKAIAALGIALKTNKDEAPALLLTKGILLGTAGKTEAAESAVRASLAAKPTLNALLVLLETAPRLSSAEVKKLCKRVRPAVSTDQERFTLLDASLHYGHSVSIEGGLSWASAEDQTWYKQQLAQRAERDRQAEEQKRIAEEQRKAEAEEKERRSAAEWREAAERQERIREAELAEQRRRRADEERQHQAELERHFQRAQEQSLCAIRAGHLEGGRCIVPELPRSRRTDCRTDYAGGVHCTSTED
jgi:hypothetical protein